MNFVVRTLEKMKMQMWTISLSSTTPRMIFQLSTMRSSQRPSLGSKIPLRQSGGESLSAASLVCTDTIDREIFRIRSLGFARWVRYHFSISGSPMGSKISWHKRAQPKEARLLPETSTTPMPTSTMLKDSSISTPPKLMLCRTSKTHNQFLRIRQKIAWTSLLAKSRGRSTSSSTLTSWTKVRWKHLCWTPKKALPLLDEG